MIGQSASSENMCTVCTVCTEKNVQHVENLAISVQNRCIFTHTKGGQSSSGGGGYALTVIKQFEESLPGKAGKKSVSENTDNISVVSPSSSSKKTHLLARRFGKIGEQNSDKTKITNRQK